MSIKANYSSIRPSLDLNFAGSKVVDPRVTFTRASTATYYDGKTVAKAEENLLTWSQEFDNAVWVKTGIAVTANNEVAPDGTTTAETITATADNATITQAVTVIATEHRYSIYLKRKTGEGVVKIQSVAGTWTAVTLTTSWQRFNVAASPTAGSRTSGVRIATLGDEIVAWGAQLEQRSSVTAYTPTTDQPITRYQPVLLTAPANTPRIDHDPITGECKGLLIEESRTNLLTYSGDLSGASITAGSRTANALVAPDGSLSACVINGTGVAIASTWKQSAAATAATMTFSCYLKTGLSSSVVSFPFLVRNEATGKNFSVGSFNQITGAVIGTGWSSAHAGNGWYRISYTNQASEAITVGDVITCYLGAAGGTVYPTSAALGIWGIQLEAGAFPTSYIPTTTAQATRAADNAVMTGTNFSSWYRQDEGAFYVESRSGGVGGGAAASSLIVADGGSQNLMTCGQFVSSQLRFGSVVTAGVTEALQSIGNITYPTTYYKVMWAYRVNDFAGNINGVNAAADTSGRVPVVDRISIGSGTSAGSTQHLNGHIKRLTHYPKRLPNAQLQALTL